jgi:tRNA(Ile)-lysidine synthase
MSDSAIETSELDALFAPLRSYRSLVLAVSGGCDSSALLLLVSRWSQALGDDAPAICVVTVDHQLRPDSSNEARLVGELSQRFGFPHMTQVWAGDKPSAGVQAAARGARYRLLRDVVAQRKMALPAAIVTAHTQDDQSETVIMRLARGTGLDGLAAMQPVAPLPVADKTAQSSDVMLVRPLLEMPRRRLEATLEAASIRWIEDPSNVCEDFERVRVRNAMPMLAELGLSKSDLVRTAKRANRARQALDATARRFVDESVLHYSGAFGRVPRAAFLNLEDELQIRVLQSLLLRHGGRAPPARLSQIEAIQKSLSTGTPTGLTIGGCIVAASSEWLEVFREPGRHGLGAVAIEPGVPVVWDQRFAVSLDGAPDPGTKEAAGLQIAALGDEGPGALRASDEKLPWRDLPHRAAMTLPVLRRHNDILAVPALTEQGPDGGLQPAGWQALHLTRAGARHFNGHNCCKMRFVGADREMLTIAGSA